MKKNSPMQLVIVIALCSLGVVALPGRSQAESLTGTINSNLVLIADGHDSLNNLTITAAGNITDSDGGFHIMAVSGVNSIAGNIAVPFYGFSFSAGGTAHTTTQTGGTVAGGSSFSNSGTYTMNGGTITSGGWFNQGANNSSSFTQNGGTIIAEGASTTGDQGIDVGGTSQVTPVAGNAGTLILSNGVVQTSNLLVGRVAWATDGSAPGNTRGVVVQEAGSSVTINSTHGWLNNATDGGASFVISQPNQVNHLVSSYTLKDGSLTVKNTKVYTWGQLDGYGTTTVSGTRTLDNSGRVVANGFGVDRTLNLSQYSTIANSIENKTADTAGPVTRNSGWYAQNHGKVTLPSFVVAAGNSTVNWGESSGDTTIDLVNSARLGFQSVLTSGPLSISLLATDRTDVPGNRPAGFIGVWDVSDTGAFDFGGSGNVDLTFRFDDEAASAMAGDYAGRLALFHYDGSQWQNITSSQNLPGFTITANDVNSVGLFAVGVIPEPSTVLLFGMGGLLLWRKIRRTV